MKAGAQTGGSKVVSVTPEIALEVGHTYAGGLGVLEGDKFYAAGRLGLDYTVLTLLYEQGYVSYELGSGGSLEPRPQPQPPELLERLSLVDRFAVTACNESATVEALELRHGTARVVFFRVASPGRLRGTVERLYVESSTEERFCKYALLAKASAEFMRRNIALEELAYVDLQEAYAAFLPLLLKLTVYRLVVHTAGPWGHPSFPRGLLASEYGYRFMEPEVYPTNIGLAAAGRVFAVSAKHREMLLKLFPHFGDKISWVTNGVDVERWTLEEMKRFHGEGSPPLEGFAEARERVKRRLEEFLRQYKGDVSLEGRFVAVWARRMTGYKRPWMVARLAVELRDLPIVFVVAGKAHPHDAQGLEYMRCFRRLHEELPNLVYVHDYDLRKARVLLSSGDLLLFTPFPGLEACGTSYMKAAANGVPTLASRDGGALEMIEDGASGWLFGEDLREFVEDREVEGRVNRRDYEELKARLLQLHELYRRDPWGYHQVALSALRRITPRASITRALREYYPDLLA